MTTIRVKHSWSNLSRDQFTAADVVAWSLDNARDCSGQPLAQLQAQIDLLGEIVGRIMERNVPPAKWLEVAGVYGLELVKE